MQLQSTTHQTAAGRVTFRAPTLSDIPGLTKYINELSKEDTYVLFSGEQMTEEEEKKFVTATLKAMQAKDKVMFLVEAQGAIVGASSVERVTANKKRSLHVGDFSIGLLKNWRGQGLGKKLAQATLQAAVEHLLDIEIIQLTCFEANTIAQNLYRQLGFKELGRLPDGIIHQGTKMDHVYFYAPTSDLRISDQADSMI